MAFISLLHIHIRYNDINLGYQKRNSHFIQFAIRMFMTVNSHLFTSVYHQSDEKKAEREENFYIFYFIPQDCTVLDVSRKKKTFFFHHFGESRRRNDSQTRINEFTI